MRNAKSPLGRFVRRTGVQGIPYGERIFFESFYAANVRGVPRDSVTIGAVSEPEARFHYNATENSILTALLHITSPPHPAMIELWTALKIRRSERLPDVGSGTGHWIDFMRQVFFVQEAVGIEINEKMSEFLDDKCCHVRCRADPQAGLRGVDAFKNRGSGKQATCFTADQERCHTFALDTYRQDNGYLDAGRTVTRSWSPVSGGLNWQGTHFISGTLPRWDNKLWR